MAVETFFAKKYVKIKESHNNDFLWLKYPNIMTRFQNLIKRLIDNHWIDFEA